MRYSEQDQKRHYGVQRSANLTLLLDHAPVQAELLGADSASKTPEGLSPSDHAAVEARLRKAN
jgi:hypothetical protein